MAALLRELEEPVGTVISLRDARIGFERRNLAWPDLADSISAG